MTSTPRFFLSKDVRAETPVGQTTMVALEHDPTWNDYWCYFTRFVVAVSVAGRPFVPIGGWKILDLRAPPGTNLDPTITRLRTTFKRLGPSYVSVAEDPDHYRTLANLGIEVAQAVLAGVRDAAYVRPRREPTHDGFTRSLLRFQPAREAYRDGPALLASLGVSPSGPSAAPAQQLAFAFRCRPPDSEGQWTHSIDIAFSNDPGRLNLRRIWAIAGNNGAGKTLLLASLARALSGLEDRDSEVDPRPTFSKIITVSYSPWDQFNRPLGGRSARTGYVYCGLRRLGRTTRRSDPRGPTTPSSTDLDLHGARKRAAKELWLVSREPGKYAYWRDAMCACGLDREGSPLAVALDGGDFVDALERSSAGEQLAAIVITRLVHHVEKDALILFDEPELHMHPLLLSALLRSMHDLLCERDAFAIVATHSPIPLQEIPRRCVRVLDLSGSTTLTRIPDEQSFGATLGEIVATAFRARPDQRNWAVWLRELAVEHSDADIAAALDDDPGLGVQMLLAALRKKHCP